MSGEGFENSVHRIIEHFVIDAWRKLHTCPTYRCLDNQMQWDVSLTTNNELGTDIENLREHSQNAFTLF